jgi:DNA modification methylase
MSPYYDHAGITIYHGDCREVLPSLVGRFDLLLTDPPYGIGAARNTRANQQHGKAAAPSKDYGFARWDDAPADIADIETAKALSVHQIIWGGNYFNLPPSRCWLVWDKDNGNNGYADCELAWTNLEMAVRRIRHRWMGMLQENMERKEYRDHPTQKPLPVMAWCLALVETAERILDPYAGSGTTLCAAKKQGLRAIGIEIEERYCEIAAKRLSQEVLFGVDIPQITKGEPDASDNLFSTLESA